MKRKEKYAICTIILMLSIGCATVYNRWQNATSTDTIQAYEEFLDRYPNSDYTVKATEKIDSLYWQAISSANTIQKYELYIALHSEGKYVNEAKDKIDSLSWQEAKSSDSIQALADYLNKYPKSKHSSEASTRLEALEWEQAKKRDTAAAYENFIRKYPNSHHSEKAKAERKTFAKIVASMLNPVPYNSWSEDGWKYNYTITFAETCGVAAKVEWLKRVYRDQRGKEWSSDGGGFSKTIAIAARGHNTYSSWVRGTVDPDLRGGMVIVSFSGHDENGHRFSGRVSSKLASPE